MWLAAISALATACFVWVAVIGVVRGNGVNIAASIAAIAFGVATVSYWVVARKRGKAE
jgi:hypothetical protein